MIDVSETNTFPKELKIYINSYVKIKIKIDNKFINKSQHIDYITENCLYYSEHESFYRSIIEILEKEEILLYHATKILTRENVLRNGLEVNSWENYSAIMLNVFKKLGISASEIDEYIDLLDNRYKRKYKNYNRNPHLCFFSDMEQVDGESAGCEQFCENIGGELARQALFGKHSIYKLLKEKGEAVIVKFKISFKDFPEFSKEKIAGYFVKYYVAKYWLNTSYNIHFTDMIEKNVERNNILEIITYR